MTELDERQGPDLAELIEDWLTVKRAGRRADDPGHSDRARRADLTRWGEAIATVIGAVPADRPVPEGPWNSVMTKHVTGDVLVRALAWLGDQGLADSSRQRLLAHLRGWCRWMTARGHLDHDPTIGDDLRVFTSSRVLDGRSFSADDVASLRAVAAASPPPRVRSRWPLRDVAIIDTLAGCGPRVSELCALTVGAVDRHGEIAMLRIRRGSKGGGRRDVPVPRPAEEALDHYLRDRADRMGAEPAPSDRLFVRTDWRPFTQQTVDKLLRLFGETARVEPPDGAMAHALRHHYGVQLALRGVPVPVIQQLLGHADPRTTSIYTRATGLDLTHALHDAGRL